MLGQIEAAATAREASLRALEASERKLRRFVADASHELRTPLAAVRAYAELFTRGAADRPADLRALDERDQPRVRAHERPRRRSPAARAARRGPAARARAGCSSTRSSPRPSRPRRPSIPSGRSRSTSMPPSCSATATACGRSSTTCSRTSARTHRPARPFASRCAAGRHAELEVADSGPGLDAEQAATSSSASTVPIRRGRGRAAAPASASRSSPPSPRRTADASSVASVPGERGATFRVELPLA